MKKNILYISLIALFCFSTFSAGAEENNPWHDMGAYQYLGGVSIGYRGESVGGINNSTDYWAQERYYEAYNLRSGVVVNDLHYFMTRKKDQDGFFDEFSLNASGINDPFTNVGLRLRSINGFDFKVNYRRAEYYLNRNDSLTTGDHKFDMVRNILNSSLSYNFTDYLGLELDYSGVGRTGNERTTVSPYLYGMSNQETIQPVFGSYSTGNIFWMNTPRNDWTNDFGGKLNLKVDAIKTNLVVGGGVRSFSQDVEYTPYSNQSLYYFAGTNLGSANQVNTVNSNGFIGGNPRNEALDQFTWKDKRDNKTTYFFGQLLINPIENLTLSADFRMENLTGTSDNGGLEQGMLRMNTSWTDTNGKKYTGLFIQDSNKLQYYKATTAGTADMSLKRNLANVLLNYQLFKQVQISLRYKYEKSDEETSDNIMISSSNSQTGYNFTTFTGDTTSANVKYTTTISTISPQIFYAPLNNLNFRVGLDYATRTPSYNLDQYAISNQTTKAQVLDIGLINRNNSKKTSTVSPYFSLYYKPLEMLKLRAKYEMVTNTATYDNSTLINALSGQYIGQLYGGTAPQANRLVPDTRSTLNASADVDITKNLSLLVSYRMDNSKSDLTPWYSFYNSQLAATSTSRYDAISGDLTMKNNNSAITANLKYLFNENNLVVLTFQTSSNKFSTPFTGTSSNFVDTTGMTSAQKTAVLAATPYNDLRTTKIEQNLTTNYVDLSGSFLPLSDLRFSAGFSLLSSTGGDILTPNTYLPTKDSRVSGEPSYGPKTGLGIKNPIPYAPLVGGPFSQMVVHACLKYQFMRNLGAAVDWNYVKFVENLTDSYYANSNFAGNIFRFNIIYNL